MEYLKRKLNQIHTDVNQQIVRQVGHLANIDQEEAESGTILKSSWASSSVRIEHQPPKLGVEGSNPSPPATDSVGAFFNLVFD